MIFLSIHKVEQQEFSSSFIVWDKSSHVTSIFNMCKAEMFFVSFECEFSVKEDKKVNVAPLEID